MNEIEKGQLADTTIQCFTKVDGSLANFPGLLKKVIRERVWECRIVRGREHRLPNLRALITEKPIAGWGQDPKKIEAVIKDDAEALSMFREAMVEKPGKRPAKPEQDIRDNVTNISADDRGNSRAYSIDVVKRKAPEFAEAVLKGEMSPNAALVKAGLRKPRQVYIPSNPKTALEKLIEHFGQDFVDELFHAYQS